MTIEIHTGAIPGRIVWGHPLKPSVKKDQNTNQPIIKDGQPVNEWAFGVAFPKDHFLAVIWPSMVQEVQTAYPQAPNGVPAKFSWKMLDGDTYDSKGKPYAERDGYAGCYILTIKTEAFAPPVFKRNAQGTFDQLTAEQIKTGDYVALGLSLKVNVPTNAAHTPGLYVNPNAIEHVAYGAEIISRAAVDPNALFGNTQYQLPPGATAQPTVTMGAVAAPGMPAMPAMGGGMPGQPAMPAMMPGNVPVTGMTAQSPLPVGQGSPYPAQNAMTPAMPAPAHDFVQNAGMPGQQPMPGMPGQQPMPGMPGR